MIASERDRILALTRSAPSPTRGEVRRRQLWLGAAAAAWSTTCLLWFEGVRVAPRPEWLALVTGAGAAVLAGLALWLAAARGGSMLGRPQRTLAAAVIAVPIALFLWKVVFTACVEGMGEPWAGRPGTRCLTVAILSGAGPFVALLLARRGSIVDGSARWLGAAVGVAAGAVAWTVNDLRCQVGYLPHLMLGHVLPLLFFVALGVTLAGWLVPRSPRPI